MSFLAHLSKIYIDEEVQDYRFTKIILGNLPNLATEIVPPQDKSSFLKDSSYSLTQGKRFLYLTTNQGQAPERCPGFSSTMLCCNYYVMNFAENCPLECSYCILQAFLNHNFLTLHVNVEEIVSKLEAFLHENKDSNFRIGTGEHSDSLALEPIFPIASYLITKFANYPNAMLELKTKTDNITSLLNLEHNGKTTLAWSLNANYIIREEEQKTASLQERLFAAKQAVEAGYSVAFHFDPLFHFPNWQEAYEEVIRQLFATVPKEKIAWISLGTLRYLPILKQIATDRFPSTSIYSGEQITTDGKIRYIKPIRKELVRTIARFIYKQDKKATVYLCMEKQALWRESLSFIPENYEQLDATLWKSYERK